MEQYDWPRIMANKTSQELKQILNTRATEAKVKVEATIVELKKRGLLNAEDRIDEEAFDKLESIDENAPTLYSDRVIYTFSILFSVIYAAILFAMNLKAVNKRKGILPVILFSVIYAVSTVYIIEYLQVGAWATLLLNGMGALIINTLFWNNYIGKSVKYNKRSFTKPLIIALLIFTPLVALLIWSETL